MKILHKEQQENWETKTVKGHEYPFGIENIDCAIIEINGRHPLQGWYRNTKVDEMIYCKSGKGYIVFQDGIHALKEDSVVFIPKNEWYYWDVNTNGVFVPMCNPARFRQPDFHCHLSRPAQQVW